MCGLGTECKCSGYTVCVSLSKCTWLSNHHSFVSATFTDAISPQNTKVSLSVSIDVVSEENEMFRVTCTATGGTLSTSSLTGPGLGGERLELQAEGSIGRTGQNTYSVTSDTLSRHNIGDIYICTATNNMSSLNSSIVLAGIIADS